VKSIRMLVNAMDVECWCVLAGAVLLFTLMVSWANRVDHQVLQEMQMEERR